MRECQSGRTSDDCVPSRVQRERRDGCRNRNQIEDEFSDDAEVAAAASAARPKQIWVGGARANRTRRIDQAHRAQTIAKKSVHPAERTETAAEGQTGNADRAATSRRKRRRRFGEEPMVQRPQQHARGDAARPVFAIDCDAVEAAQIDHEAVIVCRETLVVVSAAADRYRKAGVLRVAERGNYVSLVERVGDGLR